MANTTVTTTATFCLIKGIVQGVGFRPFVYRLAQSHQVNGWVRNSVAGVEIHAEGPAGNINNFLTALPREAPPASDISNITSHPVAPQGLTGFTIVTSNASSSPIARISPDLCICPDCKAEILDVDDRRHQYPYTNCTNCGPRFSIITALPYDRKHTTMHIWPLCDTCHTEYQDPLNRRFHAQPTCCPDCGPTYTLHHPGEGNPIAGINALYSAVAMLNAGNILAIKGLGGYHLACDAKNNETVEQLRIRKFRKEKPFALMAKDLDTARQYAEISPEEESLLSSTAAPIVVLKCRDTENLSPAVAPGTDELGIMLPYTPLHVLLFELGAPALLVLTSANRASEPITFTEEEAFTSLSDIADAFLAGERPIARRIDDAVIRHTARGPLFLRRARGYAPAVVTTFPKTRPILAVGADLKNTITLVVDGEAIAGPYVGDLDHYQVQMAHAQLIEDLIGMYHLSIEDLLVAHDTHPAYRSTQYALDLPATHIAIQHHRAHIASVLAEQQAWDRDVVGIAFDGTGYGDDGTIWGGEVFAGSLETGFERITHLRSAWLPGGDAAAKNPVQAAAGFLHTFRDTCNFAEAPFHFPDTFQLGCTLIDRQVQTFETTSVGRLFDTVAALLGFTRKMTFEGQAAIWLENLARTSEATGHYPFPDFNYEPLLQSIIRDRKQRISPADIARRFIQTLARSVIETGITVGRQCDTQTIVLSGGVFQNRLLLEQIFAMANKHAPHLEIWHNLKVPPNDGGISLGQAALAVFAQP